MFRESCELLKVNTHTLSGDNHNPMLVERFNRYLNKGLKIMVNERDTIRCALECILLLAYAWNSIPVPGTDISRSMVCVGREFQFPIDFAAGKHWQLTSTPSTVQSYAKDLATWLSSSSCREVAELLVSEQRVWHRELIASHRPDPRLFNVGDMFSPDAPLSPMHAEASLAKSVTPSPALGASLRSCQAVHMS